MASTRWISAAVLAASSAVLPTRHALAQPSPQTLPAATRPHAAPDNSTSDPAVLVDQDLAELYTRLSRPNPAPGAPDEVSIQQEREEAARRLVSRRSPRANKYLVDALAAPTMAREIKLAIARAIADEADPDSAFIDPLLPLLETDHAITPAERRAQIALGDASALALVRFGSNPAVRSRMIAVAQNAALPAVARTGIIRAMAQIVSRDVADALVKLATDSTQPQVVQESAADALSELTRIAATHDPAHWSQWQAANANKPDVVWRADVLAGRQSRMEHEDHVQSSMIDELKRIIGEQYQKADRDGKFDIVMRLLNSPDPQTRVIGIQIVETNQDNSQPQPPQAPHRVEELISDSDPDVRLAAADAIKSLNDTDALTALLTQLPQESVPRIKVAQIEAIKPMKRLRAVPELRLLLHDPSLRVATAAITALVNPGLLPADNAAMIREVAEELLKIGIEREGEPGGVEFRAETIKAVGALYSHGAPADAVRSTARQLQGLLAASADPRIRAAVLHALGDLGDPATSFFIAQWLASEPDPTVRLEAIRALGGVSTFEDAAETLNNFTSPNIEPDKAVREEALAQFRALLPKANKLEVLNGWASKFQNDPTRQLEVQLVLNDKLQAAMSWEELAYSHQNTGQTYLNLGDPARAAAQFRPALEYWQKHNAANQVTEHLIKQLLDSELQARNYGRAVEFAAKQLSDPRAQDLVGPSIRDAAERLKNEGIAENDEQKLKDASTLIEAALKMQPPLAEHYQSDLHSFQQEIAQKMKEPRKS